MLLRCPCNIDYHEEVGATWPEKPMLDPWVVAVNFEPVSVRQNNLLRAAGQVARPQAESGRWWAAQRGRVAAVGPRKVAGPDSTLGLEGSGLAKVLQLGRRWAAMEMAPWDDFQSEL